ncbi:hypothetical protein AB0I02_35125 [Streptomyces phaeochromogenes]
MAELDAGPGHIGALATLSTLAFLPVFLSPVRGRRELPHEQPLGAVPVTKS